MKFRLIALLGLMALLSPLFVTQANGVPFTGNLVLRLDAQANHVTQEATTGPNGQQRVSQWTDSASLGGANNATQTADLRRPEYYASVPTLNNQPALRFVGSRPDIGGDPDGQTDQMNLFGIGAGNFASNQATVFAVVQIDDVSGHSTQYTLYDTGSSDNHWQFSGGAGYSATFRSPRFEGTLPAGGAAQSGKVLFDIASGSNYTWFENGTSKGSSSGGSFHTATDHLLGNSIGNNTPSKAFEGYVAEVLVYNRVLNDAERIITGNYLGSKFEVFQSPSLKRYEGQDNGKGDYDFGVFGIGQVNSANNVASGTFGQGLSLMAANGTLSDGDWLLAGHRVLNNSLVPDSFGDRWERVWYVDKTTTDLLDAVITFDFSDAGFGPPDTSPDTIYHLLYSPNNSLTFASLGITGQISGDNISFLVPHGQLLDGYYTLGFATVPEPGTCTLLWGMLGLAWQIRRKRAERTRG